MRFPAGAGIKPQSAPAAQTFILNPQAAVDKAHEHFKAADRGKLTQACALSVRLPWT